MKLFLAYHPAAKGGDVPDPYYGGPDGFEHVIELIEQASESLLSHLRQRIQLDAPAR